MSLQPKDQPFVFHEGAQWIRADFLLHTRSDRKFRYAGDDDLYIKSYVDALESSGIRLGVIANRHTFNLAEFNALRTAAKKKAIQLLAGVELSIKGAGNGYRILVVFSDDWLANSQDHINSFLDVEFEGKIPAEYEQSNACSSLSLLETIKKLEHYRRDFFLIFTHVDTSCGLGSKLDDSLLAQLTQHELFRRYTLGFLKTRVFDKQQDKNEAYRAELQHHLGNWQSAELAGSDAQCIEDIGRAKACYLKLGELSFDAARLALSDPASRVAAAAPKHQASHICSVHFDGGILDGQTLHFSSELNTLIGIRGSGKSSILEALRYVLDIPRAEKAQDLEYKDHLVLHTLGSGGKITLTARDIYGQEFTISRIYRQRPNVYINGTLQPGVSIRETVLRSPIYFGQKDLSSTGEGFETDLVEKLIGEKLLSIRNAIQKQRQNVHDAAIRWMKLNATNLDAIKRDYQSQFSDANFRLRKFEEYGLAEKMRKRIDFQQDSLAIDRTNALADNFVVAIQQLLSEHEDDLRNAKTYVSQQNPDFFSAYYAEFDHLIAKIDQLKKMDQDAQAIVKKLQSKQREFDDTSRSLLDEFAQVERQLALELKQTATSSIEPDDFLTQQHRKAKAEQMLQALDLQESQKNSILKVLFKEIDQLNELWVQEFNAIKAELDRVNAGHTALQIDAEFKGDKSAAIAFMQQIIKSSNLRETTLRAVMDDYVDFCQLFADLPNALQKSSNSFEEFKKVFMQNLAELVTYQVPNRFVIRYRDKELKHHSLGQRASALLLYVLSQSQNDVIIIDQPEDDLDNQTIYSDVIKLLRQVKPRTQFIFATHNANFPVLGDAEQVLACHYQHEQVTVRSGSIDTRAMQEAIINIMEGGREAFGRRKEVYHLWKSQS